MVHLAVSPCHVTYVFRSVSTLYTCLNVKEFLAQRRREIWPLGDCNWTGTLTNYFVNEHSTIWSDWPNDWTVFSVLICTVHLTICSSHVTYALQREFTLFSCLNVKELLARSRREIWSLSDCQWTQTQNLLVCKRTLNHFAKLAKTLASVLSTYLHCACDCLFFPF